MNFIEVLLTSLIFNVFFALSFPTNHPNITRNVGGDSIKETVIDSGKRKVYLSSPNSALSKEMFEDGKGHPLGNTVFIIQNDFNWRTFITKRFTLNMIISFCEKITTFFSFKMTFRNNTSFYIFSNCSTI